MNPELTAKFAKNVHTPSIEIGWGTCQQQFVKIFVLTESKSNMSNWNLKDNFDAATFLEAVQVKVSHINCVWLASRRQLYGYLTLRRKNFSHICPFLNQLNFILNPPLGETKSLNADSITDTEENRWKQVKVSEIGWELVKTGQNWWKRVKQVGHTFCHGHCNL